MMINKMEMELKHGLMDQDMKVNIKWEKKMVFTLKYRKWIFSME